MSNSKIFIDKDTENEILNKWLNIDNLANLSKVCKIYYQLTCEKLLKYRVFFTLWLPKLKKRMMICSNTEKEIEHNYNLEVELERYPELKNKIRKYSELYDTCKYYNNTQFAIKYGDLDIFKYCYEIEYTSKKEKLNFYDYDILKYRNDIVDYLVLINNIDINNTGFLLYSSTNNLKYLKNYVGKQIPVNKYAPDNIFHRELILFLKNVLLTKNLKGIAYLIPIMYKNMDIVVNNYELNSCLLMALIINPKHFKYIFSLINDSSIIYQRDHIIIRMVYNYTGNPLMASLEYHKLFARLIDIYLKDNKASELAQYGISPNM